MTDLDKLDVEITVVLGQVRMPLHELLVLGRGAVVALDARENDHVDILANGFVVAQGTVVVKGERIAVELTDLVRPETLIRAPGSRIGGTRASAPPPLPQAA